LAGGRQRTRSTRIAALHAIGGWTDKASAQTLIDVLSSDTEPEPMRKAAGSALTFMTGIRENRNDVGKWQKWWAANVNRDPVEFQNDLLQGRGVRLNWTTIRAERMAEEMRALLSYAYQEAMPEKAKEA